MGAGSARAFEGGRVGLLRRGDSALLLTCDMTFHMGAARSWGRYDRPRCATASSSEENESVCICSPLACYFAAETRLCVLLYVIFVGLGEGTWQIKMTARGRLVFGWNSRSSSAPSETDTM